MATTKISIKVNIDPDLQRFYHCGATANVEGNTVGQCIEYLVKHCLNSKKDSANKLETFLRNTLIFVNQEVTYDLDCPLKAGDELNIIPLPFGG